jgi:hypothetical protein
MRRVTQILGFLNTATRVAITYDKSFVAVSLVTVDVSDATLEDALNQILRGASLNRSA